MIEIFRFFFACSSRMSHMFFEHVRLSAFLFNSSHVEDLTDLAYFAVAPQLPEYE